MKRYFFRMLLAGLAIPFSGISQNTPAAAPRPDTASTGQTSDTTVKVPRQDTTQKVLTLKECVDLAIKNNLQVETYYTTEQTNKVYANQAKDNLLPNINGNVSQGVYYGRSITNASNGYVNANNGQGSYSANASLLLFNGLYNQHNIRQQELYYQASKLDLQQQKDNIAINVTVAYLQVLSAQDQLTIARSTVQVDSTSVQIWTSKEKLGSVAPSDLSDLQGKYAGDKALVANYEMTLENYKITLFSYLNVPYNRDAVYEQISTTNDIRDLGANSDSLFQLSLQIIPTIKANDLRVRSAVQGVKAARGRYWPQLSFNASLGSNYSSLATTGIAGTDFEQATGQYVKINGAQSDVFGTNVLTRKTSFSDQFSNNRNEYLGFTLSIPILNNLIFRNNVKLAKINVLNAQNQATGAKNALQQQVEAAWQNSKAAYKLYVDYSEQARAFAVSFHAADVKFKNGVITSVDYITVKTNYDLAKVNLAAARYNYIFRSKILDYYEGQLKW